jgi:signal peptidase I
MNFDFPAFLVLFTFVTGVIWGIDVLLWAPKRRKRALAINDTHEESRLGQQEIIDNLTREPYMVEMARSFFPIVLIVLLVRSFLAEPFRIPSGSMMPTLLVGDFILVNKFAYGLRLPVLNKKAVDLGDPKRGDVVVFRYPENPQIDYIKRVVGVPGDRVVYKNKVLYINDNQAAQIERDRYIGSGSGAVMTGSYHRTESLGESEHDILVMGGRPVFDFEYTVPEGRYFVMGDNRDNSRDSRFWGTVPDENLIGKAFLIWMNWDGESDGIISWSRIGGSIE